jgi:O-6-methylguanine DNA methyltransferase
MTAEPTSALETDLRSLRLTAPPKIAARTLVALGFADEYAQLDSPIGPVLVAWNGRGVSLVSRADDERAFAARFTAEVGRPLSRADRVPEALAAAIRRRVGGDRRARVTIDLRGATPFEVAVWNKALEIPRGEVRPYAWVAAEIGRPKAVRAVGSALGRNPVPLVVPCHRVVRGDGTIGQYSMGGPDVKRQVLAAEGVDLDGLVELAARGIRYVGSDTTRIVCHPTCHQARRITPAHRIPFRSLAAAAARGYRACRSCRPVAAAA